MITKVKLSLSEWVWRMPKICSEQLSGAQCNFVNQSLSCTEAPQNLHSSCSSKFMSFDLPCSISPPSSSRKEHSALGSQLFPTKILCVSDTI